MDKLPETYEERKALEFFPTDPALAVKICQRVAEVVEAPASILEPSAGDGSFVRAARLMWPVTPSIIAVEPLLPARPLLLEAGATEVSSATLEEFVARAPERIAGADLIIGNPPFTLAEAHVRLLMKHMHTGAVLAFLLRLGFYGAADRQAFWAEYPEMLMYPISPRPSFLGEAGRGRTDGQEYAVMLWQKCESAEYQHRVQPRRGPHITWEKTPSRTRAAAASGEKPRRGKRAAPPAPQEQEEIPTLE